MGDITGIWTQQGWLYLAGIVDCYSRFVTGWAHSPARDEHLVETALQMAFRRRHPTKGLLHHSDRGSQYTSSTYRTLLAEHGIMVSMSRKGNCWDNALMELVWATVKGECADRYTFRSHHEARAILFEYLEVYYNRERIHSSLGYQSPTHFEQASTPSDSFKAP